MELTVETSEGEHLLAWLLDDPDVARSARISPGTAGTPDDVRLMGAGFDLLNLVVPNVIGLAGVIVAMATYRQARRQSTGQAPTVNITYQTIVVAVEGDGSQAVRRLTEAVASEAAGAAAPDTEPAPGAEPAPGEAAPSEGGSATG